MDSSQRDKIKSLLKSALAKENLVDISVDILGNTEKGDGYVGDILFVHVSGQTEEQNLKEYNLVLKCGKSSQALRDNFPIKEIFACEIYLYEEVLPVFKEFQLEKKVDTIFDSFPKCYGTVVSDNIEIIALENLKTIGYTLYDRRKPLTLNHIKFVLKEYGKFHAISAAMRDQDPKRFNKLKDGIEDIWNNVPQKTDYRKLFTGPIDDACELIKNDVDGKVIEKLQNFKTEIPYIVEELVKDKRYFAVITHGDCWNNNFMFKYEGENTENPVKVAILDWQVSRYKNPITDLSYFIYACSPKEVLNNFDGILKFYHDSFSSFVKKLGSNPDNIYPYFQLVEDWKVFGKVGILLAFLIIKIALTEKDEVSDFAQTVEKGLGVADTFSYEIKNKTTLKERLLYIINHAVERNLL